MIRPIKEGRDLKKLLTSQSQNHRQHDHKVARGTRRATG